MRSAARNNSYEFTEEEEKDTVRLASAYFERLMEGLPKPEKGQIAWSENIQIGLALFAHDEAVKTGSFNRFALDHALRILPHFDWNSIYVGEEKDRLPRRSRIMKAYQAIKDFYNWNQLLLIIDEVDAS